ncbi:MAG: LuxR C-terminal-related transcriptional regulator, partial [Geminicoccaceae bacterium]
MGDLTPAQLSERERQVAERYVAGQSYKEIARALGISPATVRTHANAVYRKLEVTSRIELLHRLQPQPVATLAPSRRLLAILCADVVGYSRLIERDEAATVAALRAVRAEVIEPLLLRHCGRVAQYSGDGILALFESVVDAVGCAAALQQALAERQAGPEHMALVLRAAVNLGDVALVDGDVYGDGVNIAARLEQLCEPGGVLVSGTAYDHLHGRLDLAFAPMGEQRVKNIERPVRVYRLATGDGPTPSPPLPDKPSLAVLPFDNLSGDPEQEYFSDGITEDLITDLSKVDGLFVLARNSTFALKGKPHDVRELAGRLGVRHVIEGSVRRAGQRVRITAQLIDAVTGGHLWAERYDRDLTDIFAVQDEITAEIVRALKIRLLPSAKPARAGDAARSVEAYELVLRGRHLLRTDGTRRAQERARS